jgi:hypothetical protein
MAVSKAPALLEALGLSDFFENLSTHERFCSFKISYEAELAGRNTLEQVIHVDDRPFGCVTFIGLIFVGH